MKPAWTRRPFVAPDHGLAQTPRPARFRRELYLLVLGWAFTFFNSVRLVSYLPTLALIIEQQNSNQHSLLTWLTWLGANLTMAGWLLEHNGRRLHRAVAVNLVNAAMCGATAGLIVWYRL
jgi:predicted anti-sigma-YlaC factor YlaD